MKLKVVFYSLLIALFICSCNRGFKDEVLSLEDERIIENVKTLNFFDAEENKRALLILDKAIQNKPYVWAFYSQKLLVTNAYFSQNNDSKKKLKITLECMEQYVSNAKSKLTPYQNLLYALSLICDGQNEKAEKYLNDGFNYISSFWKRVGIKTDAKEDSRRSDSLMCGFLLKKVDANNLQKYKKYFTEEFFENLEFVFQDGNMTPESFIESFKNSDSGRGELYRTYSQNVPKLLPKDFNDFETYKFPYINVSFKYPLLEKISLYEPKMFNLDDKIIIKTSVQNEASLYPQLYSQKFAEQYNKDQNHINKNTMLNLLKNNEDMILSAEELQSYYHEKRKFTYQDEIIGEEMFNLDAADIRYRLDFVIDGNIVSISVFLFSYDYSKTAEIIDAYPELFYKDENKYYKLKPEITADQLNHILFEEPEENLPEVLLCFRKTVEAIRGSLVISENAE